MPSGSNAASQQFTTTADALMPSLFQYLPQNLWDMLMVPFDYSVYFSSAVFLAGASINANTAIQADSHFAMLAINFLQTTTATPPTESTGVNTLVRFQDTGSGMYLDDNAQPLYSRAGNQAGFPGYQAAIGVPYLLVANTAFNTAIQNSDTVSAYNLWLTFRGVKIFGIPRTQVVALPGS